MASPTPFAVRSSCRVHARSTHLEVFPSTTPDSAATTASAPRMWRWSVNVDTAAHLGRVRSTYVEVVRKSFSSHCRFCGPLHARGGGPFTVTLDGNGVSSACRRRVTTRPALTSALRTWRWPEFLPWTERSLRVRSTPVGVSRSASPRQPRAPRAPTLVGVCRSNRSKRGLVLRAPHTCGGEPTYRAVRPGADRCSPRPWG